MKTWRLLVWSGVVFALDRALLIPKQAATRFCKRVDLIRSVLQHFWCDVVVAVPASVLGCLSSTRWCQTGVDCKPAAGFAKHLPPHCHQLPWKGTAWTHSWVGFSLFCSNAWTICPIRLVAVLLWFWFVPPTWIICRLAHVWTFRLPPRSLTVVSF